MKKIFLFLIFTANSLFAEAGAEKRKILYNSLDAHSIAEHAAFYGLYGETEEGKIAFQHLISLLEEDPSLDLTQSTLDLPSMDIGQIVALVNRPADSRRMAFTEKQKQLIERLAANLGNRRLKGYKAASEEAVAGLPPEEVDIARGLLLSQIDTQGERSLMIEDYEAALDVMALEILARTSLQAPPEEKLRAIGRYIFEERAFRFPPLSKYVEDVDTYTFLPAVMDSRRGVCLGVSALFLCLAQRLDLPMEAVTPPGHIYVRYRNGDRTINVETTARGIHIPTKHYLSMNQYELTTRNVKEVIGLSLVNLASTLLYAKKYEEALHTYRRAEPYLKGDIKLQELTGLSLIAAGKEEEGRETLQRLPKKPQGAICYDPLVTDCIEGRAGRECVQAVFDHVDASRSSILGKKDRLEQALKLFPGSRACMLHLAVAWLQLNKTNNALRYLQMYHAADASNPEIEYYISALSAQRSDYPESWKHLKAAETITQAAGYRPRALQELRRALMAASPERS